MHIVVTGGILHSISLMVDSRASVCVTVQDALGYSPRQIADLLVMRQLFFTKLGHLQHARTFALDALSRCCHDLRQTKALTDQMQALVEEQYHALLQFGAACLFGVGQHCIDSNAAAIIMPRALACVVYTDPHSQATCDGHNPLLPSALLLPSDA